MNNLFIENKILNNKPVIALFIFIYILLILPFLGNIAFDAVVHFVVAERFAEGYPFLYNINDTEKVIASTSPFWTILLSIIYYIAAGFSPIVIKSISILLWLAVGYLLKITAREIWGMSKYSTYAVLALWFANVSIVKNSLGGLENILCAFLLLLLYIYLMKSQKVFNLKVNIITGLLLGWIILTRIDAGMLALVFVGLYFFTVPPQSEGKRTNIISSLFIILFISFIVLLPWYFYQYSETGKLLSDSSVARLFTGRRNSIPLFNGMLYFHPNAITILFTAFIPLSIGFLWTTFRLKHKESPYKLSALVVVICSVIAYSLIVGADQFGRYFLICMPFFLLAGIKGLQEIFEVIAEISAASGKIFIILIVSFLVLVNFYDYYKRVVNIEQLESNIYETFYAPSYRNVKTSEYLNKLGYKDNDSIKLAVTEVQFKYFIDERVQVISLDGRSSPKILKYMNEKGLPDFEKFIEAEKPDVIEVKGWNFERNLMNDWEEKIDKMEIGDSFVWKNNKVTYIMPWHVKIYYNVINIK